MAIDYSTFTYDEWAGYSIGDWESFLLDPLAGFNSAKTKGISILRRSKLADNLSRTIGVAEYRASQAADALSKTAAIEKEIRTKETDYI